MDWVEPEGDTEREREGDTILSDSSFRCPLSASFGELSHSQPVANHSLQNMISKLCGKIMSLGLYHILYSIFISAISFVFRN